MVRTLSGQLGAATAAVLLLLMPGTASAQQNLTVDCSAAVPPNNINTVLGTFTNRNAANTLTISGTCNNFVTVTGFNRLTLVGTAGATLKRGWTFINSNNILLKSLTFDLDLQFGNVILESSGVTLEGTTIQEAGADAAVSLRNSTLGGSMVAPSSISGNTGSFSDGVQVGPGSSFYVRNMTISNNGRRGIYAHDGGAVILISREFFNGQWTEAPVDISGNDDEGIEVEGGTLTTHAEGSTTAIHVHNNGATGIDLFGTGNLEGKIKVDGNGEGDFGPAQVGIAGGGASMGMGT